VSPPKLHIPKKKIVGPVTPVNEPPLLVSRGATRKLLNTSQPAIYELEKAGLLTPVRLNPNSAVGKVHYQYAQVLALANGASTLSKDPTDTKVEEEEEERPRRRKSPREARADR
jgi:hypothetical protein